MDRRRARESAMRALYQIDLSGCSPDQAFEYAVVGAPDLSLTSHGMNFAKDLVFGVTQHVEEIDRVIAGLSRDWAVERMSPTDRNAMRIAVYEMLHGTDTPIATAINEAIEISKAYGDPDSPRFINGILGSLAERLKSSPGQGSDENMG